MGAHAYATTNRLSGLAGTSFTWSIGSPTTANKALVNDGRMDKRLSIASFATGANVIIDLGSAVSLAGFALLNHNLVTVLAGVASTVLVESSTDNFAMPANTTTRKAATTLASYLSANSRDPMNKDHVLQFTAASARYWRLTFAWSGGATPTFAIGEIFAFTAPTTITRKGIYGSGDGEQMYTSEVAFGNGESRGLFLGGPVRHKALRWADLSNSEKNELRALWYATTGNAGRVLFINSYEATTTAAAATEQDCIFGRLTGRDALEYPELDYSLFGMDDFVVQSLGREVGA